MKRTKIETMKKFLFFLSAIGLMLFTACSSEEDIAAVPEPTQAEKDAAIIAEANQDSEVEIRLGFGSQSNSTAVTRAPLESDADKLFTTPSGKYLGIYCLAQKPQKESGTTGYIAENSIDWTGQKSTLQYLMERNQPAQVSIKAAGNYLGNVLLADDVSEVQFLEVDNGNVTSNGIIYYYPYGNWFNYYFYGYYPRQSGNAVHEEAKKVTVDFTINGTDDIIYAKAVPTTTSDEDNNPSTPETSDVDRGFNAKYLRSKQENGRNHLVDLPGLVMKHKLTQLRFWVKCSSGTYESYGYGLSTEAGKKKFQVQAMTMKDVPAGWTLTVADRQTTANEGTMARKGTTTTDIDVKKMELNNDGTVNQDAEKTNDDNVFGTNDGSVKIDIPYVTANNGNKPTLLGYAMVPTTKMLDGEYSANATATAPNITFELNVNGRTYTAEELGSLNIEVPTPHDDVTGEWGFQAGKVYNVILNIPPPEEIHMHATLDQWVSVDVTTQDPQNITLDID